MPFSMKSMLLCFQTNLMLFQSSSPTPLRLSCRRFCSLIDATENRCYISPKLFQRIYYIEVNFHCIFTNSCDITAGSVRKSDCVPTSTIGLRDFRNIGVHFSRTATNVSGLITEKHNKNTSLSG